MKLNKSAYLFAAALVAGTVGMTSCSSEIDDLTSPWEGKTTDATIGFSVNGLPGTRSTVDDVNWGGNVATIKNVAVIPMIGETSTTPIKFGNIAGSATAADDNKVQRSLQSTVNRFLVYGNMPDGIYSNLSETATPNLGDINFTLTQGTTAQLNIGGSPVDVYAPHGLYYYRDTEVAAPGGTEKKAGYLKSDNNWDQVSGAWTLTTNAIEAAKSIKIQDVRYAVGVLATAVFQNDNNNSVFYKSDDSYTTSYKFTEFGTSPVKVTGIVIYDQYKTLTYKFEGSNLVPVYDTDEQNEGALATTKLSEEQKTGANFYTVVAPTAAGKGIGISIEFTVVADTKMKTTAHEYAAGDKFYMQATLSPKTPDDPEKPNSVFSAATSTMLNATVTDWGKATVNPEKPTDANVGIEFDASWIQGVVYDINI